MSVGPHFVRVLTDGHGDENYKCADCYGVFDSWAEEAPGFRLCVECCAERVKQESEVAS